MAPRRYKSSYTPRSVRRLKRQGSKKIILTIILGILVIYFMLSWGLPTLIGGLSFLNRFKDDPQKPNSSAIADLAIAPPVLNIPFEATSSSTLQISGYAMPDAEVEIYLDDELRTTVKTESNGKFQTDSLDLALGTNNISGKTVLDNKKSLPSKNIRLIYSNEKPKLELAEPTDNTQIKGGDKKIRVSGKTDPENSITVNGTTVIVNGDGNFSTTVNINDGDNVITVISTNQVGNPTKIERKVNYTSS